ncbi:hypothetical protein JB92DRAFT_3150290 [Gautieria morchelliformis]|nr:hypothetical protein JB92DRAFT_3150290 [Gautieria morchelliformis]
MDRVPTAAPTMAYTQARSSAQVTPLEISRDMALMPVQRPTPLSSPHSSQPSSPLLSPAHTHSLPTIASLNHALLYVPQRRLLVPTVRRSRVPHPRPQKTKAGRRQNRSGSLGAELGPNRECKDWVSALGKMHIVEDQLELRGYQMYAVEKWHVITVTALAPFFSLSDVQAQTEFDNAVHLLRRDGARPRETEHGVLLVTTLNNFRSDYNLVPIPDGNFLTAREQLYVNINLLRMGCSGRSALTLEEPSEPTKDRYLHMYCFSEPVITGMTFNHAVLELVKLVQCALVLFGMFDGSPEERNGLLCDVTAEGILRWTDEVGEPLLSLEPMERVGDPSVVSALLSLVVTVRNKLNALGFSQVPKDPFREPMAFMHTVSAFQSQKLSPAFTTPSPGCLSLEAVQAINEVYDRVKARGPEYRVPRMILHKIDDITSELNLRGLQDPSYMGHVYPMADLAGFVQIMVNAGNRDAVESLKALWSGRPPRRKKTKKDGLDEDERTDGKTSEEDDSLQSIFPNWGKHMKSFDFGLGRSKKPSADLTVTTQKSLSGDEALALPLTARTLPALVISGESGAEGSTQSKYALVTRVREANLEPSGAYPSSFGLSPAVSAQSSKANLLASDGLRPTSLTLSAPLPKRVPSRLSKASDPHTIAREERRAFMRRASAYEERVSSSGHSVLTANLKEADEDDEMEIERRVNRRRLLGATHRRHSMDDLSSLRDMSCLPVDRMKIDVGLCGQYLIMHRREGHLHNVTALLKRLNTSLSVMNTRLHADLVASEGPLADVTHLREEVSTALNAAVAQHAEWSQLREVLRYQADEMDKKDMKNLWRSVQHQRSRVVEVRQSIFDVPPGTRPKSATANRRFFRVQATLDPEEQRLVDWLGRTESEAEEEAEVPEQFRGMWVPPYEDLKAYAEATREEEPSMWWRWWPFSRQIYSGRGA